MKSTIAAILIAFFAIVEATPGGAFPEVTTPPAFGTGNNYASGTGSADGLTRATGTGTVSTYQSGQAGGFGGLPIVDGWIQGNANGGGDTGTETGDGDADANGCGKVGQWGDFPGISGCIPLPSGGLKARQVNGGGAAQAGGSGTVIDFGNAFGGGSAWATGGGSENGGAVHSGAVSGATSGAASAATGGFEGLEGAFKDFKFPSFDDLKLPFNKE